MDQPTFADLEYESKKRKTRREIFLERMDGLIPFDMTEFLTSSDDLRKVRPYVGESLYALVFSYRTILGRIVVLIQQGLKADYDTPTSASWSRQVPRRGPATLMASEPLRPYRHSPAVRFGGSPRSSRRSRAHSGEHVRGAGIGFGHMEQSGGRGPRCGAQIGVGMWGQPLVAIYIIWAFYVSLSHLLTLSSSPLHSASGCRNWRFGRRPRS